ncbi:PREDICTED: endoglucanase-like [Lupinus angustifolius]|uniref:endoglucanase-like n=1 Tax=Lupinus angustifolius TaxID=3871 RepID=UPI00092E6FCC|nr:PREDICTED: endoglucanase-like [Lupinus angustifolius]
MNYYFIVSGLLLWCAIVGDNGLAIVMDEKLINTSASNYSSYADALGKAILFFEGQRSGKLPSGQRVTWRGDSALSDGNLQNVDLRGGYYDAGDNVKFGWTMSFSVSLLSWSAIEFSDQISSASQLRHLQNAIRWGSDFILKSHTSPTTLYTQVGDGNGDHQCWERPEEMDTPRTVYKIDANSPGTEVAADAAAALASASIVFKKSDPKYSSLLLTKSKSLFDFADKYRGSYSASCPFYCSNSGYQDELLWAASWIYKASRESKYLDYVLSNQGWSHGVPELSWDNKFIGAQTLLTQEFYSGNNALSKFKGDAESFICTVMPGSSSVQIKTTPGGLLFTRDASNLQYVTSSTMVLMVFSKILQKNRINGVQCGSAHFSGSQIKTFAKTQVDYILGNNPMKMSYMVGFGSNYPKHIHHRGSSIPSIKDHPAKVGCNEGLSNYLNSPNPNPNIHVGAIVGGPDSNDHFSDARSDYSQSEPTTYINAAFVGSVAALLGKK